MKGFTQMDYMIAVGIFIVVFALVIQIVSNFFADTIQNTNLRVMTSEATDLIGVAEDGFHPTLLGLATSAYRINVRVNNTPQYWYNQALPWEDIANELVKINFTDFGISADVNSTAVYDDSGNQAAYEISGNMITFVVNVPTGVTKNYTVYFDDDSNFSSQSVSQSGVDNLSEIVSQAEKIYELQYRKIIMLNSSDYSSVKNSTGLPRDFRISVVDNFGGTFFQFGGTVPTAGNIIALRRFILFQNSTGGIRRGYLNVQVW